MDKPSSGRRTSGPPPAVMAQLRRHLSQREVQGLGALFTLRATAQQVDNALSEWMADSVGSLARYQILMGLWASKGKGIPHSDIVAAMGVTRATISGLMSALEREGFVKSYVDPEDRRKLIAQLTTRGDAAISKAFKTNLARFRDAFATLSSTELERLAELLHRFRQGFAART